MEGAGKLYDCRYVCAGYLDPGAGKRCCDRQSGEHNLSRQRCDGDHPHGVPGFKITIHFGIVKNNTITINGEAVTLDAGIAAKLSGQKINFILKGE